MKVSQQAFNVPKVYLTVISHRRIVLKKFSKNYGLWLGASTSDMLSRSICTIVLPFVIVEISGSIATAGVVNSIGIFAYLIVMPFGGVLVDRIDRRLGMYTRAISGAILWLVFGLLLTFNLLKFWQILVIVVAVKVLDGLFGIADNAALRSIIPDDKEFTKAIAINQGRNAVIEITGGPIGGFLYAFTHALPYYFSAALLSIMTILTKLIGTNLQVLKTSKIKHDTSYSLTSRYDRSKRHLIAIRHIFADIHEGFNFIWAESILRICFIVTMALNTSYAFTNNTALYYLMSRGYTAFQLSILESGSSVLMLIASIFAGKFLQRFRSGKLLLIAFTGILAIASLATLSHTYLTLLIWLSFYGLAFPFTISVMQGYLFSATPVHLQGRVNSIAAVIELAITAFVPAITSNLVATHLSTFSFAFGSIFAIIAIIGLLSNQGLRNLGKPSEWHTNIAEFC